MSERNGFEIAIIGMAGRFPKAADLDRFWQNLRDGVEGVSFFTDEELAASGISPSLIADPNYVKAAAIVDGIELFDASFFDIAPREAEILDPQHRLLLECAWEALEKAGHAGSRRPVGVFAGAAQNSYVFHNLLPNPEVVASQGHLAVTLANEKDFLATRLSYKLGLQGPSATVQTACSTSLMAVHLACQSLLGGECELALAGGVSVWVPQKSGRLYHPGSVSSPDGHCRAFDAAAEGTVSGQGFGLVVLRLLEDALADGDHIHAVIKGSASNNDGSLRAGFTAPSRDGQARVIAAAQIRAGVDADSISYVEAHGTATPLGDPIEVAALIQAFRETTDRRGFCALGSVKTGIGHLDAAAGVASLIKTALALEHREIPASLHFNAPNPEIDFASSPFFVAARTVPWETDGGPRRAGVSSFGLGGTNVHVILEEAPPPAPREGSTRAGQLLLLSARTPEALETATDHLAAWLEEHSGESLADVAHTLQTGRVPFRHRRALLATDITNAGALGARDPRRVWTAEVEPGERSLAFLLPGVGDHYLGMARGLYRTERVFREELDRCAELLRSELGLDLREALFSGTEETPEAGLDLRALLGRGGRAAEPGPLHETRIAQPAVMAVSWALAQLWMSWGMRPQALVGYSLGEYTAACLAGVMALEDGLTLVARRARLISGLPPGAMLAVPLAEADLLPRLTPGLSLAAENGPGVSVVAGPVEAVEELERQLTGEGLAGRRLPTTHAFHSAMMEPVRDRLAAFIAEMAAARRLAPPSIPYLSNVTGTWITAAQATDPLYWAAHLCRPVRFGRALETLWARPRPVLLEVGPGQGLSTLALQHPGRSGGTALASLRHAQDRQPDELFLLGALARLWLAGVPVDWEGFAAGESRRRVPLPTYPFERRRFWIDAPRTAPRPEAPQATEEDRIVAVPAPALPSRHERPRLPNPYVAPETPEEQRLAALWQELLGLAPVGLHDNFFELGGHSLLGTQMMARLRTGFGVELPLSALFESPTVAEMARALGEPATGVVRPPVRPRPAGLTDLPLSFAQQRLWFLDRLEPGNPFYNIPAAFRLGGPFSPAVAQEVFREIVRRHEGLRTTFPAVDGAPSQVITPWLDVETPLEDLSALPEPFRSRQAVERARDEARWIFDLVRGPLLRVRVLRLGAEDHVLLLTLHHIVSDGWSMQLLLGEVVSLYGAFAAGRPSPLPPLPVQYADYALWQRQWLQGEVLAEQVAYWRDHLAGAPPALEMPTDRPHPPVQTFEGLTRGLFIPPELTAGLHRVALAGGASPFMALLASFATLLHRSSGQDDIVIGSPIANRTQAETEALLGVFVNTLALRTDLSGDPPFRELLARVRRSTLGGYDHQDLPFDRLVEELQPERNLSRPPLFQVFFQLHNQPVQADGPGGSLAAGVFEVETGISLFDLTVSFLETGDRFSGSIQYNTGLFDAATIDRLTGHFLTLIGGLTADPGLPLGELPLLSAAERAQLAAWSGTEEPAGAEVCLHHLFEAQVARTPDAVAAICGGARWTYRELDGEANRLAHRLVGLGVGPEVRVGICLERSLDLLAAILAVLKAGGAYVPLDPAYPAERRELMLEDSGARVVVTREMLALDGPSSPPRVAGDPGQLAYVIYTSGSTGRPKGVGIEHRSAGVLVQWARRHFSDAEIAGVLAATSICFDLSVFEIFVPLAWGGTVILAQNALELAALPAAAKVTLINTVPSAIAELARQRAIPPSVETVCLAGEPLRRALVQEIRASSAAGRILNLYGPSEDTTYSTWSEVALDGREEPTIGGPVAGTRACVLDAALRPAPVGVPGELCLAGTGLARGYLGRPELTAERFVPDPESGLRGAPGGRLYRTGDLARWRPDGALQFLGRRDRQVKVRGFRIELEEVEAALRRLPAVGEAVALVREDGGDRRLVAWVVPAAGPEPAPSELREDLRACLPEHMVPSAFVTLAALPLTPNGKVDRRALPAPEAASSAGAHVAPRSPVEEIVAEIWGRVLQVETVSVHDNFFDQGGHSLLATQLLSRLSTTLRVELPLRVLFDRPTVADLAAAADEALKSGAGLTVPPIEPRTADGDLPLSWAQQRLWFFNQLEPQSPAYNIPFASLMSGRLDRAALEATLTEMVARHETLRTTFALAGGEPVQRVGPPVAVGIPLIDLRALPRELRHPEVARLFSAEEKRPFDLRTGPLLRVTLLWSADDEHVLFFNMHHIVSDGWSIGLTIHELGTLYAAFAEGRPSPLAPLPIQYADFALWQRRWLTGEVLDEQLAWWRERLAGAPAALELPADRPRPPMPSGRGGAETVLIEEEVTDRLAALARSRRTTPYMTLMAAWKALLFHGTGRTDLLVGTPIANRNRAEIEELIGFFVNTLVLRTDLSGDPPFVELVDRVREVTLGAYARQDLPFDRLVEELAPERSLAHNPLFQVVFVLHNTPGSGTLELPGLRLARYPRQALTAMFDLTLSVTEVGQGLFSVLEYNSDLFDRTTALRLGEHYRTLLAGIAADPRRRLSELSVLTEAERQQVREWNDTRAEVPALPVHERIVAQARRAPEALALVHRDEKLAFRQLDERSDRLADRLRALGVGPEVVVGLCMDRSADAAVALLAVLRAGGAYLPLDPAHPAERLAYMLETAGARLLLTRRRLLPNLPPLAVPAVCADDEDESPIVGTPVEIAPDSAAYVLYTSGSTGRPKGVAVPHRALANHAAAVERAYGLRPGDRVLQFAALSFDVAAEEILPTWCAGATVVMAPERVLASQPDLARFIVEAGLTVLNLPAAYWHQWAWRLHETGLPPHLRLLVAGSERVLPEALAAWRAAGGDRVRWLNAYGVTEAAVTSLLHAEGSPEGARSVPVGRPLDNVRAHVLDAALAPVAAGVAGELYLAGDGLARGYAGRPDLTAERFLPDPFAAVSEETGPGRRLYRTGDLARRLPDGAIEVLGRADQQLKVRGFRIEPGEIEALLAAHPAVAEAVVGAVDEGGLVPRLTAWLVPFDPALAAAGADPAEREVLLSSLRTALRAELPEYMVPGGWVLTPAFPRLASGKVDRRSVERLRPAPEARAAVRREPRGVVARAISAAWREVLQVPAVGSEDNFFDLGGHSLLLLQVQTKLRETLGREVPVVDLFRFPTVSALTAYLAPGEREESEETAPAAAARPVRAPRPETGDHRIAIIGMSGRFPGASSVEELWANLCAGVESILPIPEGELEETDPALLGDPRFVRAAAAIEGPDRFDADFFGFTPRDAEITDPQHRVFLECSWEALESAGYDPASGPDRIGVFAGVSFSTYLWNLYTNPEILRSAGPYKLGIATDKDHVTTTVSYKLNLTGPSVSVQTACSTSLVAVHMACRSLLHGECEMALAGGSSIATRQRAGYLYQEGGILSPDGHCRAFDAGAQGTVRGNGVGVVLLKRLEDALADGDPIHAVLLGSAINNDGSLKVGYTAPSVEGQAQVIGAALADSGVDPRTITYIEAHGTGTPLGDPIEVAALTQAFAAAGTAGRGFCALGSIKSNLGHLDTAAGIAGLIKAALAAERGLLPPSLHFEAPNPAIDFVASPFYVNARLAPWQTSDTVPRRAGVSSFGIGGTNAHVILEEPPAIEAVMPAPESAGRPAVLVLSARTPEALEQMTQRLRRHLEERPDLDLCDVAWTLQAGRRALPYRRALVSGAVVTGKAQEGPGVAFLFPGQGAQYPGMGLDLYRSEPVFREQVDRACEILRPELGLDPREVLFPAGGDPAAAARRLEDTALAQPLLFVVEHALARLWMSWGVRPAALIGHSLGEYVAACLAGVFSPEEALALVAARGRLIAGLAGTPREDNQGAMASLPLPAAEVLPRLPRGVALAAVNGPSQCVVSGRAEEVDDLLAQLAREGVQARRLHTSHAFHSELMDPVLEPYAAVVERVRLAPPRLPCISNLTGTWLTAEQATDPGYWVRHLRETVRFGDGLAALLSGDGGETPAPAALLEVGPGRTLTALARRHPAGRDLPVLPSLRHPDDDPGRGEPVYASLAHLWTAGAAVDWRAFQGGERRRRVRLPTYPFERQRYWVDLPKAGATPRRAPAARRELADWFHVPFWRPAPQPTPPASGEERSGPWLVFLDDAGVGERLLERWRRDGGEGFEAITVRPGGGLARLDERDWTIDPRRRQDYDALLEQAGPLPARVIHLWSVAPPAPAGDFAARLARLSAAQDLGLYSLLFLSQALHERLRSERVEIAVLTGNTLRVTGAEALCPERATVLGLCQTIPSEHPGLGCRHIDLELPLPTGARAGTLLDRIAAEVRAPWGGAPSVAFRGAERWVQGFAPAHLDPLPAGRSPFREGGVYLITGGLGGIALEIAGHLAAKVRARLVLVGRTGEAEVDAGRAARVRELRERGAEVLVAAADAADLAAMRGVVSQALERFGRIDGVIHTAGLPGGGLLALRTRETLDEEMRAKVQGTLVAGEICREIPAEAGPSFLALFSSVNSFTGQIGQAGYAAANNFLDAYAHWHAAETGIPTVALNWDRWQGVGMSLGVERLHRELSGNELTGGIAAAEGVEAFERALASGLDQVVVSWLDFGPWLDELRAHDPAAALSILERASVAPAVHARNLETEYVPPGDELEEQIAALWQEVFGIERIGIHDDFFALGGDSLVALQLVSRIGKTFGVELKVGRLFETPTVAGLAVTVEEAVLAAAAPDALERALDEMEVHP